MFKVATVSELALGGNAKAPIERLKWNTMDNHLHHEGVCISALQLSKHQASRTLISMHEI